MCHTIYLRVATGVGAYADSVFLPKRGRKVEKEQERAIESKREWERARESEQDQERARESEREPKIARKGRRKQARAREGKKEQERARHRKREHIKVPLYVFEAMVVAARSTPTVVRNALQRTATRCHTLQHTATHCNICNTLMEHRLVLPCRRTQRVFTYMTKCIYIVICSHRHVWLYIYRSRGCWHQTCPLIDPR